MGLKETLSCIRRNKSFLVTTHVSLEGDALGSELAFWRLLKLLGKRAFIVDEDDVPESYRFLPWQDEILKFRQNLKVPPFDVMATLDCSDLKRTGEVYKLNQNNKPVLNIDHHISNDKFGAVNWVEPQASCASEMVFELYKKFHIPLDRNIATCLYAGIIVDTGSFRYTNTTARTHQAAAQMLAFKIDVRKIYQNILGNVPYPEMQILSRALLTMKSNAQGRLIWFEIKRNLLKGKKLTCDLSENVLNFGRSIKGAQAVALFKENLGEKQEVRVNLRSEGRLDVNKIARFFGGGGHKSASGITIRGKLASVKRRVLQKIRESF